MALIAICGEIYSQNLGDGVIADSLLWLLKQASSGIDVISIDISDRRNFGHKVIIDATKPNWTRVVHRSLARFQFYRKAITLLVWYFIKRNRFRRLWREKLGDCDLILIGGGQLLMDNDFNFPLKVYELVRVARSLNKNVAFQACGVGNRWSWFGVRLFKKTLTDKSILWISVRDMGSRNSLQTLLSSSRLEYNLSIDPAVCSAEAYGLRADSASNIIGLGISAPDVLSRHVMGVENDFSLKRVRRFWLRLIEELTSDYRKLFLFTNGDADDYSFAKSIITSMSTGNKIRQISLLKRAHDPYTLMTQVAQCQAIVAHRLHANIIAYSLGIPSVGLIWDKKVGEFGKLTSRSYFYLDPIHLDPLIVKQRLYEAMSVGIDLVRLAEHKAEALRNVQAMLVATGVIRQ